MPIPRKYTQETVDAALEDYRAGVRRRDISAKYGISLGALQNYITKTEGIHTTAERVVALEENVSALEEEVTSLRQLLLNMLPEYESPFAECDPPPRPKKKLTREI